MRMSGQSRYLQRLGIKNRLKIGQSCNYQGKTWKVASIQNTKEKAEKIAESRKKFNDEMIQKYGIGGLHGHIKEKEYTVRKMKRTLNYGKNVWFSYYVLMMDI